MVFSATDSATLGGHTIIQQMSFRKTVLAVAENFHNTQPHFCWLHFPESLAGPNGMVPGAQSALVYPVRKGKKETTHKKSREKEKGKNKNKIISKVMQ